MHIRNLPAVTPRYRAAILAASMCDANHNLHLSQAGAAAAGARICLDIG
jgi:hypothetical protein